MAVTNCNLTPQREKIIGDSYYCGVYEGWRDIYIIIRRQENPNGGGRRFAYRWCTMDYDFEKCWANLETVEFKDKTPFRLDLKNLLFQSEASTITLNYDAEQTGGNAGTGDNPQTMALLGQISAKLPTTNNSLNVHGQVEVTNHSTDYAREETLRDLLAMMQLTYQQAGLPVQLAPNQPTLQVELVNPTEVLFPDVQKVQVINPTEMQKVDVDFPEVQQVSLAFPEVQKTAPQLPSSFAVTNAALGAPEDAAAASDTATASLVSLVKRLLAKLPFLSLGQKTAAASLAVTIASDQPALPITGSVSLAGTPTVALAAGSAVSISGSVGIAGSPVFTLANGATVSLANNTAVTLSGTPTVALAAGSTIALSGTPTVALAPNSAVAVTGNVGITGSPTVSLAAGSAVAVTGNVGITGTPTVALAANTTVALTGTPTVALATGTSVAVTGSVSLTGSPTVTLAGNSAVAVTGTVIAKPFADASQDFNFAAATSLISLTPMVVAVAPGANLRNYLTGIQYLNTATLVSSELQVKSGTTLLWRGFAASAMNASEKIIFETPLRGEVNQPITITALTVGLSMFVNAQGYKAA